MVTLIDVDILSNTWNDYFMGITGLPLMVKLRLFYNLAGFMYMDKYIFWLWIKLKSSHFCFQCYWVIIALLCQSYSLFLYAEELSASPPVYSYTIINTYPHDSDAFTQGLAIENEVLFEGTGLYGKSALRKVDLRSGQSLEIRVLPAQFFGEGLTVFRDKIIQLTWKSKIALIYDKKSFKLLKKFNYPFDGWGITHNGNQLITSDGTDILRIFDPETLQELNHIRVFDNNGPVTHLNELEYVQGEIYANVWFTDRIARISPETGRVVGWIDLEGIMDDRIGKRSADAVLNGIAYDEKNQRLFVTGKLWPKLFEIKLIPGQ